MQPKTKTIRIIVGFLAGFVALTAIGGGIALLVGAEGDRFPLAWLEGTPFSSYTIPGLILAVIVGGSALIAAVIVFRGHQTGAPALVASGVLLAGFVGIEALILKQVPHGPTPLEIFYFGVGTLIFGLGVYLWRAESQPY